MYRIKFTHKAVADVERLRRGEPAAFKKLSALVAELAVHPRLGTGKPEALRGDRAGQWSRRITHRHRLVYEIHDDVVLVLVVAAYGHYEN